MTRVGIVTGGAQGIGRAVALRLAADGVDVAVIDLPSKRDALGRVAKDIEQVGRKSMVVTCDVSKESEVQSMVENVVEGLGSLDIMVANAGIMPLAPLLEVSEATFDRVINVNLKGVLFCYRAAAAQMIKQGRGGRVIGASSTAGINGSVYAGAYSVSKFGVRALTQIAALEWGKHNITVNAYAPGATDTPLVAEFIRGPNRELLDNIDQFLGNASLRRVGQPKEVAAAVSFLASEAASYVTGQTLGMNGGSILS